MHTETRAFATDLHPVGRHAAIVLLHGRAGPYSSLARGRYDASTLSKRHKEWGTLWAERGYVALLVDSFGPRGYPEGFVRGSYEEVSAEACEAFSKKALTSGAELQYHVYPGAEHNFDDPGRKKQSVPANARATADAMRRAEKFFKEHLGR